ncbi:MAG: DUF479 domain-containing protein [Cyclobacteriaceae bacterium]
MNFLAHLFLSFDSETIAVGNFIADFVKGSQAQEYDVEIQKGIQIHRDIDTYTDTHPVVKESKNRLWKDYRHYSSVIVDMYYDHLLAKKWDKYSDEPLREFTQRNYDFLSSYSSTFPSRANLTLYHMKSTDWLYNYQFLEGIGTALRGMSRRASFDSKMEMAVHDLKKDYELYSTEFDSFFPQIISYIQSIED